MAERLPIQKLPDQGPADKDPQDTVPQGQRVGPVASANQAQQGGDATLRFEQYTDPGEKTRRLEQAIGEDAQNRGYDTVQGLELTVTDEEGSGRRYVVMDESTQPVYEPETRIKRFSRPRIEGALLTMPGKANEARAARKEKTSLMPHFRGRHAFSRLKETSDHRNRGMFRPVRGSKGGGGSGLVLDRRREKIDPQYKSFVTVGIYQIGQDGPHIATKTMPIEEFFEAAGARLSRDDPDDPNIADPYEATATWNWHNRRPDPGSEVVLRSRQRDRDLEIGLTRGRKPVFEDVAEQLEDKGITNWTGLTWELPTPGIPRTTGSDSSKDKAGIKVVSRLQTIIDDSPVKERKPRGADYRYARRFIIRTTEVYEDGTRVVDNNDQHLKDYELWHYMETPGAFPGNDPDAVIYKMYMPDAKKSDEELQQPGEALMQRLANKNMAHRFTVNSRGEADEDRAKPLLEEALGMLSLRDHTYPSPVAYPDTPVGYAALSLDIAKRMDSKEERKLGEELQEVANEVGYSYFDAAVREIHGLVREEAEEALDRLGIGQSVLEEDFDGWVADALLERSRDARARKAENPFMAVLTKPNLLREIVDEHVGERFGRESLKQHVIEVPEGRDEDGKPIIKQKVLHEFNEELFDTVPFRPPKGGKGSYALTKGVRKWREKIWGPIRRQTDEIYKRLDEGRPVYYYQNERLGRALRRTVGE